MKTILTDIDHVVLVHGDAFVDWLSKYKCQKFKDVNWRNYKNFEDFLNTDSDLAYKIVNEFNTSKFFGELKPGYKSEEVIPKLYNNGYKFVAITACGDSDKIADLRRKNLETYFPGIFRDLICVNRSSDKRKYLESYDSSIWVEDTYSNAIMGYECGHTSFLIDHYHNQDCGDDEHIIRVNDWEDIEKYLYQV